MLAGLFSGLTSEAVDEDFTHAAHCVSSGSGAPGARLLKCREVSPDTMFAPAVIDANKTMLPTTKDCGHPIPLFSGACGQNVRPARQSFFRAESQRHLRLLKGGGDRYSRGSERRLPWLSLRIPPPKNSTANGFVRCCSRYLVTRARSRTFARP